MMWILFIGVKYLDCSVIDNLGVDCMYIKYDLDILKIQFNVLK